MVWIASGVLSAGLVTDTREVVLSAIALDVDGRVVSRLDQ